MKINFVRILLLFIIFLILYFLVHIILYNIEQKRNNSLISYCKQNTTEECYTKMFDLLTPELLVYSAYKDKKELLFAKMSRAPLWHPFLNFEISDSAIFYTESRENIEPYDLEFYKLMLMPYFKELHHFENRESQYNKFSFSVINDLSQNSKKCIVYYFPLFINDDFINILLNDYSDVVNGFVLFVDISQQYELIKAVEQLRKINEKFILVSRNSSYIYKNNIYSGFKYYKGDIYDGILVLSYINKKIVDDFSISVLQDTNKIFRGKKVKYFKNVEKIPVSDIHWVVTFTEIIKQKMKKWIRQ